MLLEVADLRARDTWPFCGDDAFSFIFIMFIVESLLLYFVYDTTLIIFLVDNKNMLSLL